MPRVMLPTGRKLSHWVLTAALFLALPGWVHATDTRLGSSATPDQHWRRSVELVTRGQFEKAADELKQIADSSQFTTTVRSWLDDYLTKQAERRALDLADFEKYVGYSKERIERKEYALALDWAIMASDVAQDREAFLKSEWLLALVHDSLAKADEYRKSQDWRKAWHIYADLGALYDREPRYLKLEREVLTHLRLDNMFKDDQHWRERLEKVRWADAEYALECVDLYYVEPADFKAMTEAALEQMLLLAESKTAQEQFGGLRNADDRTDFVNRIAENLRQVRAAPRLTRKDATETLGRVVKVINKQTVRLPDELVVNELMRGALDQLDDFTTVIWPQETDEFDKHTRGDFVGVGISIVKNRTTDEIEVVSPLEDTPAYRAGIQAGDIITEVDGQSLKGFSLNKVVDTITGPRNTTVTLTVVRAGKTLSFPLKRALVKIQSVKGLNRDPLNEERWNHWLDQERGIGYIRVTNFMKNTVEDVANILSELDAKGLKTLVLDLRSNPGGLLESAWRMSSLFLKRGENVVSTRGRDPAENQRLDAMGNGPWASLPVIVLVDENSASASEIVAGAIQDTRHGIVLGARTFGKFSVQNLIQLSRSSAKLKITTARYYLPSGKSLHRETTSDTWGVEPDIDVRLVRKEKINLYRMRREADLLGPAKVEVAKEEDDDLGMDDEKAAKDAAEDESGEVKDEPDDKQPAEGAVAEGETPEEPKLPPLKQPDENNRPKRDPQLEAALLLARVQLLGDAIPTVATADVADAAKERKTAKP